MGTGTSETHFAVHLEGNGFSVTDVVLYSKYLYLMAVHYHIFTSEKQISEHQP